MVEKIVKETFKPDPDEGEAKKDNKVIEEVIEEESGGGIFIPEERGAIKYPDVILKKMKENENKP